MHSFGLTWGDMGAGRPVETIYGYLERITYYNEETDFLVAKLQEKGKRDLTTIVGRLAGLNPGESLKLSGAWTMDKKFGQQFRVDRYETVVPATVNGIKKYLGSGLIRGIGPVMAERIVKVFGADTLDVIETAPEKLATVDGIGTKRIAMITRAWSDQKEIKEVMVFLQGNGVSAAYAAKIFKQYGKESISVVRDNPYRLAADIRGIGFVTADRIASSLGIDPNSVTRAQEGLIYVLNEMTNDGHVYYPLEPLVDKTAEMLKVERGIVSGAVDGLLEERRIFVEPVGAAAARGAANGAGNSVDDSAADSTADDRGVYLAAFHTAEANLARSLLSRKGAGPNFRPIDMEKAIAWVEQRQGVTLAGMQREAVAAAAESRLLVITGGPGTGKTTIIRCIVEIFSALKLRTVLAAPTGRAAKRIEEATGCEARTIHRLLQFNFQKGGFQKNQDSPLDADVVIIDEASMIDTILMYNLIKAIPPEASLILVGDIDQLPSVGPGNVLRDIIDSGVFKVITLNEIFRQGRESLIVVNAHRINRGEFPLLRHGDSGTPDFYFFREDEPEKALERILKLCSRGLPERFGFDPVREVQVLSPMHRGIIGAANLNAELQRVLNPGGAGISRAGKTYKTGDKVIQTVNNYDKEIFNGDIGVITGIDNEAQEVAVDFDGRPAAYDFSELDELELAYAISVHKSQGSEYPAVVMPVMTQHYMMLMRNLVYTGITRGKKLVVMIGARKALAIAIRNNKTQMRYTLLGKRLSC
jgi:exodeoxyribonuclease V alpha subunit